MDSKIEEIQGILSPVLFDMGFELVDLNWFHWQGRWVLRLRVDKESGVNLADCVRISKEVGVHLDSLDIIDVPYSLEVSSPGLDRPLRTRRDFERFIGSMIHVHTANPLDGRSNWKGILQSVDGVSIKVEVDHVLYAIPIDAIGRAALVP